MGRFRCLAWGRDHKGIFKNNQIKVFPCFTFTPKTAISSTVKKEHRKGVFSSESVDLLAELSRRGAKEHSKSNLLSKSRPRLFGQTDVSHKSLPEKRIRCSSFIN